MFALMRRVLLFTATVMIGDERVELMLFDTTGQVMISALAPVHSLLSSPSCCPQPLTSVCSGRRRTTRRTFIVNHVVTIITLVARDAIIVLGHVFPTTTDRLLGTMQLPIPLPRTFSGVVSAGGRHTRRQTGCRQLASWRA